MTASTWTLGDPAVWLRKYRAVVEDALEQLDDGTCCFWACPGPDKPFENMKTCKVCAVRIELRAILYGHVAFEHVREGLQPLVVPARASREGGDSRG